jgi:hypothetical protein
MHADLREIIAIKRNVQEAQRFLQSQPPMQFGGNPGSARMYPNHGWVLDAAPGNFAPQGRFELI